MDVSIIIVSWKVRDLLDKCLASVYAETREASFEVIVVDNASGDGTVEMVATKYPEVQLVASNINLGFAKANNVGMDYASGDFVLLLNPDTELLEDAVSRLVAFMHRMPSAAIAGPRLLNVDGTLQPSVRRFPTLWSQVLLMLKVQGLLPNLRTFRHRLATDFDYSREQTCDQVMGAAFMIRPSTVAAIGRLDERFWIWFEEVDYCRTAAEHGLQTWYTPSAQIQHLRGESFNQAFGPAKQGFFDRSARAYFLKHHGWLAWAVLLALRPCSWLLAWLAILPKRLGFHGLKV